MAEFPASRFSLRCEIMNKPKKEYRYSKDEYQGVCGLKQALLDHFDNPRSPADEYRTKALLDEAAAYFEGFLKDVAQKALRYKKISDKQAYFLASGLIDGNVADWQDWIDYAND